MRIAIVGAGFTGLSAAYSLLKKGHSVTIFEKEGEPGGLALGFHKPQWEWTLEEYYHHWFTNDDAVLNLAKELNYDVIIKRPKTSVFVENFIYQLDSVKHVLSFPKLSLFERCRMGATLGLLKYDPLWKPLEKFSAAAILPKMMGEKAYHMLWEPQLKNKFGKYTDTISLAWFWARVAKRTSALAYPKGGFLAFTKTLAETIEQMGGKILYNSNLENIQKKDNLIEMGKYGQFDACIVTVSSFAFLKLCPQLPEKYKQSLMQLKGLGAMTLVLRLKKQFLQDNTYWLSICDPSAPVMAIVEHTNFMDKTHYNNEHIVYLGNYLSTDHPNFAKSKHELLKQCAPFLKKINSNFEETIIDTDLFKTPFAQPIIPINYSHIMPPVETPLKNMYLANMQQVYPWDRGTNYAVELGEKVAKIASRS